MDGINMEEYKEQIELLCKTEDENNWLLALTLCEGLGVDDYKYHIANLLFYNFFKKWYTSETPNDLDGFIENNCGYQIEWFSEDTGSGYAMLKQM